VLDGLQSMLARVAVGGKQARLRSRTIHCAIPSERDESRGYGDD
jgi:hypothetical protein